MRQSSGIVQFIRVMLALGLTAGSWAGAWAQAKTVTAEQAQALLEAAKSVSVNESQVIECSSYQGKKIVGSRYYIVFFWDNDNYRCRAESGKPPILFTVLAENPSVNQTVPLLYDQFASLGQRLTTLHAKRAEIKNKYAGYGESFLADIDSDIVRLSKMGMQLANLTIRFYDAVEPGIIRAAQQIDVLGARTAALTGLKDFTADIDTANRMVAEAGSDSSLKDVLAQVEQAVRELERAVGQSNKKQSR